MWICKGIIGKIVETSRGENAEADVVISNIRICKMPWSLLNIGIRIIWLLSPSERLL